MPGTYAPSLDELEPVVNGEGFLPGAPDAKYHREISQCANRIIIAVN